MLLAIVLLFIGSTVMAGEFNLPQDRTKIPSSSGMTFKGEYMRTQLMQPGGTISQRGWQKGDVQLIMNTFQYENLPYSWYFVNIRTGHFSGRIDIDNDGYYEEDFNQSDGMARKWHFKPAWPTAYE